MNATSSEPSVTVLITSKDRKELLAAAIDSVLRQTVGSEILVVDDGSTDGTSEMVAENFPSAVLIRNPEALGIIAARNAAAEVASGDILITLDDDAQFKQDDLVESVIRDFANPRVGVVAIPYWNHFTDGSTVKFNPIPGRENADFVCQFMYPGGSNAMRRKLFLKLGGYSGSGRQFEEPTFAAKVLDAGYLIRASSYAEIDHYPQYSDRDHSPIVYYGARNAVLFAFTYVPLRYLPGHLGGLCSNRLKKSWKKGFLWPFVSGFFAGFWDGIRHLGSRSPVTTDTYRLMRQLIRTPAPLSEVESRLPPPIPID